MSFFFTEVRITFTNVYPNEYAEFLLWLYMYFLKCNTFADHKLYCLLHSICTYGEGIN